MMQTHPLFSLFLSLLLLLAIISGLEAAEQHLEEQLETLKNHGIATETSDLVAFLRGLQPNAKLQDEIDALIKQLASMSFSERESATAKLATFGPAAREKLIAATKSQESEVVWRSEKILKQLESDSELQLRKPLMIAALQILKNRGEAEAVPVLIQTLRVLDDAYLRDVVYEAIWASVDATHATMLQRALSDENLFVQAAAIVGLEVAVGEKATVQLTPHLKSNSAQLRLAAARALTDRQPRASIAVLIELVGEEKDDIAWQADRLLQMISGKRMELSDEQTLYEAWQVWSVQELPTATLKVPLGANRFDLCSNRYWLEETFSREAKSLAKGYGRFQYQADNFGRASVVDGKLLIDGDNNEGDQRLFITSQQLIGREEWPSTLEVRANLGGKEGNNFGWHVGVSVGRVKTLFHPGLSGGAFRAETVDAHEYLFGNEGMGFTPAADAIHEMIIKVVKKSDGAEFDIAVRDAKSDSVYKRKFNVTSEQLGKFDRIGLERSGRRGADAMFDSVSIKLGR